MWNERPRSIRARLALRIVIGGGALLALLFSALDLLIDYQLYSRFDEALAARGRQMAADIGGGARIEHSAHHGWPEFRAGSHTDYYQLWDAAGVTVARSGSSAGEDLARPARPVDGEAVLYDVRLPDGHRGRAAAFQISGEQLFVIASEREALDILESRIHVALAAGVGIALLLMVTLSHAAVRAGLRPLEAFGQRAAARARDPETPAAPETPLPDELRPIGAALDNAFAELTRALLRERRFARDLAHELRTPLAELFSLLETTRAADDASRSRLALAGSTLTGMSRIVDGLLALARYEAGIDAPVVEPVDIAAAARTQCLASEARARVRGITLDVRLDPERWVMTDSLLIERILANLLGNAIDHSPDGGRIEVSCCAREESVTLVTSNAAPDLDATDVAGLGLALCSALAGQLDIRLAFDLHEGDLPVQLEKLPSISIEESAALDLRVEQKLLAEVPEIAHVVARLGSDELGFDPMGLNQSDVFLQLKPKSEWREPDKAWLGERIREVLEQFPGVDYGFTQPIEMRVSEMLTGSRGDVAVKVFGPDLATLGELAAGIEAALRQVPGNQDVFTLTNDGVQYLTTRIDRLAAGHAGLSVVDVQDELRARIEGRLAGTVLSEGRRTPLLVRGDATLRGDAAGLSRGSIAAGDGSTVPLAQIASVERVGGPVKVDRENGSRYSLVQANVAGRDLVGFVEEARQTVARTVELPAGYSLAWGGQFENQQRAAKRLALVVPAALLLIFLVLFMTFGSARQALLILANIPFALVGGVLALWLTGEYMSVPASVGFIALLGIAVLNGLVLVAHFNQLLAQGLAIARVVEEGARRRLRPVLMTAAITALGLVPMLFATGPGSEIQRPLAIVVIGGLFSSTLLTLLLLPVLFRRFARA